MSFFEKTKNSLPKQSFAVKQNTTKPVGFNLSVDWQKKYSTWSTDLLNNNSAKKQKPRGLTKPVPFKLSESAKKEHIKSAENEYIPLCL